MKFFINNNSNKNPVSLMRSVGYYFQGKKRDEMSFVRVLGRSGYPRFHIYLRQEKENNKTIINLHLDQKKPVYPVRNLPDSNKVYKIVHDHAAEYDSEVVKKESERIKNILNQDLI